MAARDVRPPPRDGRGARPGTPKGTPPRGENGGRYQPLPTGTHGLDPELVKSDQRERLQGALVDLIADKGYPGVRIVDLAKLAHVSQPTFYTLFADKEDLFLSAYDEIAVRAGETVVEAYAGQGPHNQRMVAAMHAWLRLAAREPRAISLLVQGAFGAGPRALARRRDLLDSLERRIYATRASAGGANEAATGAGNLTVEAILGGIREVTAARLRDGRAEELPGLAEELAAWASCYPRQLPAGLEAPAPIRADGDERPARTSERARRAEGRLPSGRSELPRQFIVKSQRERIVDATAAIVAEKGLPALTVPEIARRANISHQTFYSIYDSKHDAFLGAQKVGMHQALVVAVDAYRALEHEWPRAAGACLRALVEFLASEPAHAHLSLVDTFAACPQAIEIRDATLRAFAALFEPAYELARNRSHVPAIAGEAIAGGIWQILHHYIENDSIALLPATVAQLTYFALTPFLGSAEAAAYSLPASA